MDRVATAIERWAETLPELDTSGTEVVGRVLRAAALLEGALAAALAPHGLQPRTYSVLAMLRSHGGSSAELPPKTLAANAFFTTGGMTNLLTRLEQEGLVARRSDPSDGRGVLIRLTDAGRVLADAAAEAVCAAERAAISGLSGRERRALARDLSRLLEVLEPGPPSAR